MKRTIVDKHGFHAGTQHVDHHRAGPDVDMERRPFLIQSTREPRRLEEIVRIERRGRDTIGKAWVRISERNPWCNSPLIIDFPFHEITRQCSKTGKEVRAKKRRTPPDNRTVTEKLSHGDRGRAMVANRSSPISKSLIQQMLDPEVGKKLNLKTLFHESKYLATRDISEVALHARQEAPLP